MDIFFCSFKVTVIWECRINNIVAESSLVKYSMKIPHFTIDKNLEKKIVHYEGDIKYTYGGLLVIRNRWWVKEESKTRSASFGLSELASDVEMDTSAKLMVRFLHNLEPTKSFDVLQVYLTWHRTGTLDSESSVQGGQKQNPKFLNLALRRNYFLPPVIFRVKNLPRIRRLSQAMSDTQRVT